MQEVKIPIDFSAVVSAQKEIESLSERLDELIGSGEGTSAEMDEIMTRLQELRGVMSQNVADVKAMADATSGDLLMAMNSASDKVLSFADEILIVQHRIKELNENLDQSAVVEYTAKQAELTEQIAQIESRKKELEENAKGMEAGSLAAGVARKQIEDYNARITELKGQIADYDSKISAHNDAVAGNSKELQRNKDRLAELTAQQTKAQMQLDQTKRRFEEMAAGVTKSKDAMLKSFQSFQNTAVDIFEKVGLGAGLMALVDKAKAIRAENQKIETDLATLLGEKGSAAIMKDLQQLALVTPLGMGDMANAEKTMVSFGLDAKKSVEYIKALSDISGGEGAKFNSLALAFSQASAAGKLMGQDLIELCRAA